MRAANHLLTSILVTAGLLNACAKKENTESELSSLSSVVATSTELPECTSDMTARVYWVEDQQKMVVCNGKAFVEIVGEKGDQGDKGENGSAGPAGSPANSGVWVFDGDSKPIGVVMDGSLGLILFTNGAFARIDLNTGDYLLPVHSTNGVLAVTPSPYACEMTASDCSGTCYSEKITPRGAIMRASPTTFYVATGTEAIVNNATVRAGYKPDGTCTDYLGPVQINAYAFTTIYAFPDGITLPLKTPLSFGFKTEE
jgi:hypothetical protein